jgi:hypothetical protein
MDRTITELTKDVNLHSWLIASVNVISNSKLMEHNNNCINMAAPKAPAKDVNVSGVKMSAVQTTITPAVLSKRWGISLETAKRTLEVTTQSAIRNIFAPAERKIRKPAPWLHFPSITGKFMLTLCSRRSLQSLVTQAVVFTLTVWVTTDITPGKNVKANTLTLSCCLYAMSVNLIPLLMTGILRKLMDNPVRSAEIIALI